ncbi:MAG: fumarate hydratase C-terminal domain-containing protein [Erysipelotrichaceae bacterium]|nr:fumarate hydratase C-terminal domain-containing protein [Erysipelotrichaceae bacterium]
MAKIEIKTPVSEDIIKELQVGDMIEISGYILCGRDAVLPEVVKMIKEGREKELGVDLEGQVVFHTAVSKAGVGPTSSNKLEIESSIIPLSRAGVRIHLGKGKLHKETVEGLDRNNSVYALIPPVTALLGSRTSEEKVLAFEELGMEALHLIKVDRYPAIIASAHGRSIYDQNI